MNADTSAAADDHFTALLIACDEALAAGEVPAALSDAGTPAELRPRLQRGAACLQLLGQVWPTPARPSTPVGAQDVDATVLPFALTKLGRFEIRRALGQGGFGVVFLAYDSALGRLVALKVPHGAALVTPELRQRFRHEAQAAARLDHPNLVPVYEAGEVSGVCYLASAYCPGVTLATWLARRGEPMAADVAATLVATLAEAVHHAHSRGVLHRDLKPSNVLLTSAGDNAFNGTTAAGELPPLASYTPKITDFGLAKVMVGAETDLTHTGAIVGTARYMAPEQAAGRIKDISTAADVYALGGILYELVAGRSPFEGDTVLETLEQVRSQEPRPPHGWGRKVARDLETICLKCLQKDPARRYVSAAALAEDLHRFREGKPVQARPIGFWQRALQWARHRPTVTALIAVCVLAPVLLVVVLALDNAQVRFQQRETAHALVRETAARRDLTETLRREQHALYFRSIALAHHEWLAHNVVRTEELLEACPPEFRQWEWHYLKRLGRSGFVTLRGHTGTVSSVAWSPDGRYFASASGDRTVKIWEAVTRTERHTLRGHGAAVVGVAFSPDGQRLASASHDRQVKIWDVASGKQIHTLAGHAREVVAVAFSPDGARLASASWDGTVRIWDAATGKVLRVLDGRQGRCFCVAFSPDGQLVAAGNNVVQVWDAATGQLRGVCGDGPAGPPIWVGGVAFHPDGQCLASAHGNKTVGLWDTTTFKPLDTLRGHASGVNSVAFSPDGARLASAGYDQAVRLWDAASGEGLAVLRGHGNLCVTSVSFSPDGKHLVSGGEDHTVRVWERQCRQEALTIGGGRKHAVVFSPSGAHLATVGPPALAQVWDATTGKLVADLAGHVGSLWAVAYSPEGKLLATAGADRAVKVWDTTTWKNLYTLPNEGGAITSLAFSRDGGRLAAARVNRTVKVWNPKLGKEVYTLRGHGAAVTAVAFSPDGERLASASADRTVKLWDTKEGRERGTLQGHSCAVTGICFSPNGQQLASASQDRTIKVWDANTARAAFTLRGHTDIVLSVRFSPDGKRLASSARDGTVKIWDAATGQEVLTLRGHFGQVNSVAFSGDGKRLASVANELKIWDATSLSEAHGPGAVERFTMAWPTAVGWVESSRPTGRKRGSPAGSRRLDPPYNAARKANAKRSNRKEVVMKRISQ